jgi:anti-sigma regulatory factor (Ser/Thr protein kinase)
MFARIVPHLRTGALVIKLTGRISLRAVGLTERAVARCLAHYPPAVVIDCARVIGARRLHRLLFTAVVHRGGRLSGTDMVVCAGKDLYVRRPRTMRRTTHYADLARALSEVRPHHVPSGVRRAHLRLAATPEATTAARQLLRRVCREWGLPAVALDCGQLIVSELVSNASEHAGTDIDVTVCQRGRYLRIAVADRSPTVPNLTRRMPAGAAVPMRGRGLPLVARYATRMGAIAGPDGKVIWASVALPRLTRLRAHLPDLAPARRLPLPGPAAA